MVAAYGPNPPAETVTAGRRRGGRGRGVTRIRRSESGSDSPAARAALPACQWQRRLGESPGLTIAKLNGRRRRARPGRGWRLPGLARSN